MKKKNFPSKEQIEREARLIQADQAIEGFWTPLEEIIQTVTEFYENDEPRIIRELIEKADREGRSDLEVVREYYSRQNLKGD